MPPTEQQMRDLFGEEVHSPNATPSPTVDIQSNDWGADLFGRDYCDYWMVSLRDEKGKVIGREQKIQAPNQKLACIRRLFKLDRELRSRVHRFDVGGTGNHSWEIVHWIYGDSGLKPIGITDLVDPAKPFTHWYG